MADGMAMAEKFQTAMRTGDFNQFGPLIQENTTDDFVQEWPQSGERLTRETAMRVAERYPEMSRTSPRLTPRRMFGAEDMFVIEATIDYGDGVPVSYVGIGELRGGKVARMTEYFANPFEPPEWRAGMTQRMETARA